MAIFTSQTARYCKNDISLSRQGLNEIPLHLHHDLHTKGCRLPCGCGQGGGQRKTGREGQEGQHPGHAQGDEGDDDGDQDQPRVGGGGGYQGGGGGGRGWLWTWSRSVLNMVKSKKRIILYVSWSSQGLCCYNFPVGVNEEMICVFREREGEDQWGKILWEEKSKWRGQKAFILGYAGRILFLNWIKMTSSKITGGRSQAETKHQPLSECGRWPSGPPEHPEYCGQHELLRRLTRWG